MMTVISVYSTGEHLAANTCQR